MNLPFEDLQGLMASARPDDTPVGRRGGEIVDFRQFRADAAGWRAAFAAAPGQRFALYFEDTLAFAAALFGLWHAGKCAVLPGDMLPATADRLTAYVDGFAGDLAPACMPLAVGTPGGDMAWQPLDPSAQQLIVFTSGSTGEPAAIPKRLEQMFAEVRALQQVFGPRVSPDAELIATVSHQHIYGLLFRVLWPLASGRVLHAERLSYLEDVAPQLEACGAVLMIASPAHLKRLPELRPDARLQAVFSSGGPLPDAAVPDCIARLGQAPIEVYGSSETGGVAWRQRGEPASVEWQALPGVEWRLQDGEVLEIRSEHLETSGWTATADRAAASPGGFTLLGRADRVIKIEEKRVSLAAIERALLVTGWLLELRVQHLPGPREQLGIVAVPSESGWALLDEIGKKALASRLRGLLLLQLDASSAPRHWRFVSALPANAQGKTTQDALLALFDPRRPQPRVLSLTPTSAELAMTADASLPQFDGHFPGHPVLPGVAQIEWAILLARDCFPALPPSFLSLESLKFQQVITPGVALILTLDFKPEAGRLSFKYSSDRGQHASGRVLFGPS